MLSRAQYRVIKPVYDQHIKKDELLKLSFEEQIPLIAKALRKHPSLRRQTDDLARAVAFIVNVQEGKFEDPLAVRELAGFAPGGWPDPQPISVTDIAMRNKEYLRAVTAAMRYVDYDMLTNDPDRDDELTMLFRHTLGIGGLEDLGTPEALKTSKDDTTAQLLIEFLLSEILVQRPEWFEGGELQDKLPDGTDGRSAFEIEAEAELEQHLKQQADRRVKAVNRRETKRKELEQTYARFRESLKVSGALDPILEQLRTADDSKFADCRKVMSVKGWLPQDLDIPEDVPADFAEQYVLEQLGTELQPEWMMQSKKNGNWVFRRGIGFINRKGPSRVEKTIWGRIDKIVDKYGLKESAPIMRAYLDKIAPNEDTPEPAASDVSEGAASDVSEAAPEPASAEAIPPTDLGMTP